MKNIDKAGMFLNGMIQVNTQLLSLIKSQATEVVLKMEEFFVKDGEVCSDVGFLVEGVVRSFFVTDEGKEYNKTLFVAPDIIGSYVSLITGQPNRLPQQALVDCVVLKIPFSSIEKLSENDIERLRRRIAERFFVLKKSVNLKWLLYTLRIGI